jgi:hypothetical protein
MNTKMNVCPYSGFRKSSTVNCEEAGDVVVVVLIAGVVVLSEEPLAVHV